MSKPSLQADGGVEQEAVGGPDIFGPGGEIGDATVSRGERFSRIWDRSVVAPFRVAWSDWRARIGGLICLFYLAMGTVGLYVVDKPTMNEGPPFVQPFSGPMTAIIDTPNVTIPGTGFTFTGIHFWEYPFGTDLMGQSITEQIVHATPAMLKMALAGVIFASGVAVVVGVISGYKGGAIDRVLMTFTDIIITIPGLPLIIIIAAVYPPRDPFLVGVIIAIDNWPGLARALRSQVLTIREENYVESARAMGISTPRIFLRDLIPQLMPYIAINSAGAATGVIGQSTALYFLGVLPFTTLNWGVMLNLARTTGNAIADPFYTGHWLYFPAIALSGLLFGLVLFSQGLDRVFNPRLRARHAESISGNGDDEIDL